MYVRIYARHHHNYVFWVLHPEMLESYSFRARYLSCVNESYGITSLDNDSYGYFS